MLDPEEAGVWLEHHFDTVTDEEFIENVRRFNPDFAEELWGSRTTAEILAERAVPARAQDALEPASVAGSQTVATAVRNPSPVTQRGVRGLFAALGRSVLKIFS